MFCSKPKKYIDLKFWRLFLSFYVKYVVGRRYHLRVLHKRFERSFHGFYPQTWTLEPHYMSPKQLTVELLSLFLWDSYILIPTKPNEIVLVKIVLWCPSVEMSPNNEPIPRPDRPMIIASELAWISEPIGRQTNVFVEKQFWNVRFPSLPLFAFFVSGFASYGFFAFLHVAGDRISVSSTASSSSFPEVQSPKILPEGKHSNNIIIIIADSSSATKHITTTTTTTTTTTPLI